jgi:uncharacterized lipoprotein YbaY
MRLSTIAALAAAILLSACQKPPPKPPKPIAGAFAAASQLVAHSCQ